MATKPFVPTLDEITAIAQDFILQEGSHVPMVYGYMTKAQFLCAMPELPPMKVIRFAMMRDAGRMMKRKNITGGTLTDTFFISEAWMVKANSETELENQPPPSEHPNRIEVLIIVHHNTTANKFEMRIREMVRAGNSLDLVPIEGGDEYSEVYSELLNNFLIGWGITPPQKAE